MDSLASAKKGGATFYFMLLSPPSPNAAERSTIPAGEFATEVKRKEEVPKASASPKAAAAGAAFPP